jgi:hypothetical protein
VGTAKKGRDEGKNKKGKKTHKEKPVPLTVLADIVLRDHRRLRRRGNEWLQPWMAASDKSDMRVVG